MASTTCQYRYHFYVDKTQWIYELVRHPKGPYFLSRPRRFGKSLMVSILAEVFAGNRELFEGLWIDQSDYQWETHPIIRIDFSLKPVTSAAELKANLNKYLYHIAEQNQLTLKDGEYYEYYEYYDLFEELLLGWATARVAPTHLPPPKGVRGGLAG